MPVVNLSCYPVRMKDYPLLIEAVSRVLKRVREDAGLSKRKLAELSEIDRVYLLQIEQGKYRPTINSIFLLAKALGMPASKFVALIEQEQHNLSLGERKTDLILDSDKNLPS